MKNKSVKLNAIFNGILKGGLVFLPLITFPYITRTLQADNYGKLSFCYSIICYFELLAGLGINSYAVREGSAYRNERIKFDKFASEIYSINLIASLFSYSLLVLLIYLWKPSVEYVRLLAVYSIEIFSTTISVEWIYNIFEEYFYIAIRTLSLQAIKILLIFTLIKNQDDYYMSAVIDALFFLIIGLFNHIRVRKFAKLRLTLSLNLKKHIKPIMVLFANTLMVTIYVNSDITMLGIIQSENITGIYRVSAKIYGAVKAMLNGMVVVAIPRLALYINSGKKRDYNKLINKVINAMIILVTPTIVGLVMISRNIIMVISGEGYISGVPSLIILCIALGFAMVSNLLLNAVLILFNREYSALKATAVSSLVNIVLNLILIPRMSLNGAAFTTLFSEAIVMLMCCWYSRDLLHISINKNIIASVVMGAILIVLVCLVVNKYQLAVMVDMVIKIFVSVIVYVFVILLSDNIRQLVHIGRRKNV